MRKNIFKIVAASFLMALTVSWNAFAAPQVKVACVGDSITYGLYVDEFAKYPTVLGNLLGPTYKVMNYGVSNASVSDSAIVPYKNTDEYRKSLEYDPDVVVIMLGTNDAKGVNWTSEKAFTEDYLELAKSYPEARIVTVTPPKAFCEPVTAEYTDPKQVENIADIIEELSEQEQYPVIDINKESKESWIRNDDGIHTTNAGSVHLACMIYRGIKNLK